MTDALSFEEAYPGLFVLAKRVAVKFVQNPTIAEDVAAETMARALVRWKRVQSYPEAWVTRVSSNRAIDLVRRQNLPQFMQDVGSPCPIDDMLATRVTLISPIQRLPRRQRQVVSLRFVVGLEEREIAEKLRISIGTVRTHHSRALVSLRMLVGGDLGR